MPALVRNRRSLALLPLLAVGLLFGACDAPAPAPRTAAAESPNPQATEVASPAPAVSTLANVKVLSQDGQEIPIVPAGGGVILVISSQCPHCHALVEEWGKLSHGTLLPKLHVIVLEGAKEGIPVLEERDLSAAQVSGPIGGDIMALAQKLDVTATPTLLQVAASGEVLEREEGSLGEEQALTWIARSK